MIDYFYRFADEQEMFNQLSPLGMAYVDEEGVTYVNQGSHEYAAWVVGQIEGVDGYHYNLRLIDESFDVSSLEPFLVIPKKPRVVWA